MVSKLISLVQKYNRVASSFLTECSILSALGHIEATLLSKSLKLLQSVKC